MKINELSKLTHLPISTIRYYEKNNVLDDPERAENNYRIYTQSHVEKLQLIKDLCALDFSLNDIKHFFNKLDEKSLDKEYVLHLVEQRILTVETQLERLKAIHLHLKEIKKQSHLIDEFITSLDSSLSSDKAE